MPGFSMQLFSFQISSHSGVTSCHFLRYFPERRGISHFEYWDLHVSRPPVCVVKFLGDATQARFQIVQEAASLKDRQSISCEEQGRINS